MINHWVKKVMGIYSKSPICGLNLYISVGSLKPNTQDSISEGLKRPFLSSELYKINEFLGKFKKCFIKNVTALTSMAQLVGASFCKAKGR